MNDIDELNNIEDWEDIDSLIDDYFDEMEISEEDKEKRKDFAKKFTDKVLFIFALYLVMQEYNRLNRETLVNRLDNEYRNLISQYIDIDDYLDKHIKDFSNEVIDTTIKNGTKAGAVAVMIGDTTKKSENFYTSEDRAFLISVNEANTGFNYQDYIKAIESGKTRKIWITEKDNRVRKTHRALDNKSIPILNVFSVGKTYMRFPHDTLFGTDFAELSNCRCTIKYL